jgi:Mg2+/Co2+ transporter CorC
MYIYDSAFNLQDSKMKDVMQNVKALEYKVALDTEVNMQELGRMQQDGHSLVPVFNDKKQVVVATLVSKSLLGVTMDQTLKKIAEGNPKCLKAPFYTH